MAVDRYAWTDAGRARSKANGLSYVDVIAALHARKRILRPTGSPSFVVVMARPEDDPERPVIAVVLVDADKARGVWQIQGARYLTDDETAEWEKWT